MPLDIKHTAGQILAAELALLIIDGQCPLCNKCAQWLARRDLRGRLIFTTISDCRALGISIPDDTITLITGREIFTKSTALLTALQMLGGSWSTARYCLLLPQKLRDFIYDFISKKRYKISAKFSQNPCNIHSDLNIKTLQKQELITLFGSLKKSINDRIFFTGIQ
jgi:predicted DCC family thiol-disulfide oxidoreductase YuxK